MHETRRLLEAATALSTILAESSIPHAFYGSVFVAVVGNAPLSDEIFCVVEGGQGQTHPFRRVRDAVSGRDEITITHSPWTNRLCVTYRRLIPAIEIEIQPAGEFGPRHLDTSTVTKIQGVPFLTPSEFIRAKLKTWVIRGSEADANDISYTLARFWNRVDYNRIPEQDMNVFVSRHPAVSTAWTYLKQKYGA